ncbi:unnamed protein product, partial [Brenthis ino]
MEESKKINSICEGETTKNRNNDKELTDLDEVLKHELGEFGCFQLRNMVLVALPIVMSAFMSEYIFSSAAVSHRCRIPECGENNMFYDLKPDWILNAVPETSAGISSCQRFDPLNIGINGTLDYCPVSLFNKSIIVTCGTFVYAEDKTVVSDFNLGCQEWMRALPGTFNSIGTLLVLPIIGYLSDNFGRRMALIISVFNLALIGVIRAFSVNYTMYLSLQILQTTLGGGTFSSAYIFAAELVGPRYRVVTSATCSSLFAVGQIILGSVAWLVTPWRYMILVLHIPCFLIISYYWILNESVRWLLSKCKFEQAREVLEKVAKINKKHISEKSMEGLFNLPKTTTTVKDDSPSLFKNIIQSPILLRRVCTTPMWWITATFVYYGLSINSTSLAGSKYLNYILISAIDIPGNFTSLLVLDKIGRKATLSIAFFFSAACNIAFVYVPKDVYGIRLAVFLLGKFGAAVTMTSTYLFTSELYPTQYRHSLLGFSSMVGRIGSIAAPLTPALMSYWHGIPSMMFGCMGILSGILVLTQPETLGMKMPNTLAEAEALGKSKSKNNK